MSKVISTKVDDNISDLIEAMAGELNVTKSWIVNQALRQYLDRYDEYISDIRIASLGQVKQHKDIKGEYAL